MTAFRKQPLMFIPPHVPSNMTQRDWLYLSLDAPTYLRKPARKYERKQRQAVSALVRRQAD